MNTKQIKLKFRDTINRITGKQPLIEEYFALVIQLSKISDKTQSDTQLKKYLMDGLDAITEHEFIYLGHGVSSAGSYNPYKGSKETTQKKIMQLREMLSNVQQIQQKQMAAINTVQHVR